MIRKCLTCFLIIALLSSHAVGQTKAERNAAADAARIERVKTVVNSVGIGEDARIEIQLKRGRKVKGYVSEVRDDAVVVTEAATETEVRYADAASAKATRPAAMSKKQILFVVALIGGATVVGILAYKRCKRLEREGKMCPPPDDQTTF